MSEPGAAPPSFWSTPNQGSVPIWKLLLAGVATIVAMLPGMTDALTVAPVDGAPPLISTEHQLRKFITVSVRAPEFVAGLGVGVP
jgi:phosphoribosylcarboxyaminoimidazole (NCAIR) mutase